MVPELGLAPASKVLYLASALAFCGDEGGSFRARQHLRKSGICGPVTGGSSASGFVADTFRSLYQRDKGAAGQHIDDQSPVLCSSPEGTALPGFRV